MNKFFQLIQFSGVLAIAVIASGCATSGRHVLLQEYQPTVPSATGASLSGIKVCVQPLQSSLQEDYDLEAVPVVEPTAYEYQPMDQAQEKRWDQDKAARKKATEKTDWIKIGYLRNMFGAVMSYIYALNDPAMWLTAVLKMDLQNQGMQIIDQPQPDAFVITGNIQFLRIDMYMKNWADLVVDLEMTPPQGPPVRRCLHTSAGQTAWSSSSFEFYQSIRQCQQKLSWLVIQDLEKMVRP